MNGDSAGEMSIIPGKFGTATSEDIYLNDGKGELDSEMSNLPNTIDLQQSISGEDESSTLLDVIQDSNALIQIGRAHV